MIGPRKGTRAAKIFRRLTRPNGATAADMANAGLGDVAVATHAQAFAARFGMKAASTVDKASGRVRWFLK